MTVKRLSPLLRLCVRRRFVCRLCSTNTDHARIPRTTTMSDYPHKFTLTTSAAQFVTDYNDVTADSVIGDETVAIAGRILRKRSMGKIIFYTIVNNGTLLQAKCTEASHDQTELGFRECHDRLHIGDIVGFSGHPCRTKTGELSVLASNCQLLTPCLRHLPSSVSGLKDDRVKLRQPYLSLLVTDYRHKIMARSRIIQLMRQYFHERQFIEVETPMLTHTPGGALARPFITFHNDLQRDLFLRISPELSLKMLVIGGMERVFEIGRSFRNESLGPQHLPEFTMCELYEAYADYNDHMNMTEHLINGLVNALFNTDELEFKSAHDQIKPIRLSFKSPYRRLSVWDVLREKLGAALPQPDLLANQESRAVLDSLVCENSIHCDEPRTTPRLLDKLIARLIEPECVQPTFLIDHPQVMSPLAKWHRHKTGLSERFELFIAGKEIANAYTELNDPDAQRRMFDKQKNEFAAGDDEAIMTDHDYVTALEYGLPPTAGWGLGIDRLTMVLTQSNNIKDVNWHAWYTKRRK